MSENSAFDQRWVMIDRVDDIAIVYLNRADGRRNALNTKFHQEIGETWYELSRDETLKTVIITGKINGFVRVVTSTG